MPSLQQNINFYLKEFLLIHSQVYQHHQGNVSSLQSTFNIEFITKFLRQNFDEILPYYNLLEMEQLKTMF